MIELQGSDGWFARRVGKITGSRIKDMLSEGKGITRAKYAFQLVAERMSGKPSRLGFKSAQMERGNEMEPFGIMAYESVTGIMCELAPFSIHSTLPFFGASPDRLIGDDGVLECKCPDSQTHYGYLLKGVVPTEYIPQMQAEIACTGRKWADFISYDDEAAPEDRLFIIRYTPTEEELKKLEAEVTRFNFEVEELIQQIIKRRAA